MSRLEHATEIADLAADLGLDGASDPVDAILRHCRTRIDRWVSQAHSVTTIGQLEILVTQRLQMVFEEIRSDADFARITDHYARVKKDPVFATMRFRFDDAENPTFGALVKRKNVAADAPDRFVAVIDCRGSKLARRFFTRWHEIAHRLTTHADKGAEEPAYRSEHDPIERMMDEIAGHIGFYGPFFEPVFQTVYKGKGLLTFETVKAVLDGGFPEASFQATLNACAKRLPTPVVYLEAALGHKAVVKREIEDDSPGLFGKEEPPEGQLRAVKVVANDAAHGEKFVIPTNMRVPEASVIHSLFVDESGSDGECQEDLSWWESQGKRQEGRAVAVEARRVADRVIAIVQPVEPVRQKARRAEPKSMFEA
jgi:hypothetical protein